MTTQGRLRSHGTRWVALSNCFGIRNRRLFSRTINGNDMNRFLLSVFALLAFCGIPLQAADMPRPEYPRPQFVREAWQNLNSTWTYTFDFGKSGLNRRLQPDSDRKPVNIVFVGNSITYGATLPDREIQNPCVQAAEELRQLTGREVTMRNCGHSGMTTHNFLPGGNLFAECLAAGEELSLRPGTLVFSIMLGTNDSAQRGPTGSPEVVSCRHRRSAGPLSPSTACPSLGR